jgi:pimeloyl-ACP methyl ester carboxylesterase
MSSLRLASGTVCVSDGAMSEGMDWVVLLHGLFASRRSMRLLENAIRNIGYGVHNWGYSTWWRSTDFHVARLLPLLDELQTNPQVRSINFVTHSMGGILVRSALHVTRFSKVKRFVMLAPPNRGSHLTRIKLGPFAWCVPSIADLSEAPDSLPNRLSACAMVEIGVIAASRDLVVPIANTSLANQSDHCIVTSSHFSLPKDKMAVSQVLNFLQTGKFSQSRSALRHRAA